MFLLKHPSYFYRSRWAMNCKCFVEIWLFYLCFKGWTLYLLAVRSFPWLSMSSIFLTRNLAWPISKSPFSLVRGLFRTFKHSSCSYESYSASRQSWYWILIQFELSKYKWYLSTFAVDLLKTYVHFFATLITILIRFDASVLKLPFSSFCFCGHPLLASVLSQKKFLPL